MTGRLDADELRNDIRALAADFPRLADAGDAGKGHRDGDRELASGARSGDASQEGGDAGAQRAGRTGGGRPDDKSRLSAAQGARQARAADALESNRHHRAERPSASAGRHAGQSNRAGAGERTR